MARSGRVSSADFRTLKPRVRVHGAFFSLSVAPSEKGPAFACVVSKKVSPKAVTRNLVKRRCRAAIAPLLKSHREKAAYVFYAKKEAAGADFAAVKKDITDLLGRALARGTIQHS